MKNIIVLILSAGLVLLLLVIVVGDFYISLKENKPPDEAVINLLQMSVTGVIGVVAGHISGKPKD